VHRPMVRVVLYASSSIVPRRKSLSALRFNDSVLEDDFTIRKSEFVAEIYAFLEVYDSRHARMVLNDLKPMWL
jgi:hypothetical protein